MSLDLFQVYGGIGISTEDLTSNISILQGIGSPVGADADAASTGSTWHDTTSEQTDKLNFWWKWKTGAGLDKWTQAAPTSYVTAAAAGISWREPVVVLDKVTTLTASLPAGPAPVVDGVTIADGQRVLFGALTDGGGANVYIWHAINGVWVEDTNNETDGDALFVQQGTAAEQEWVFDGLVWFQFGGSSNQEILNIRNFIGKDLAGANYPNYVSTDVIADGIDLRLATSRLDDAIGQLQFTNNFVISDFTPGVIQLPGSGLSTSSVTDITDALNKLDATYGSGIIANITANYSLTGSLEWGTGTLTITDAFNALNNSIGIKSYTGNILTSGQTVTASLEALDLIIGDLNNSSTYTAGGFLSAAALAGNSVQQTVNAFNVEIGALAKDNYTSTGTAAVSTTTPLEPVGAQLTTSEATEIEWVVQVKDSGGKRQSFKVHALTNGTVVDFTTFAIVKTGGNIGGSIGFNVVISSGNIVPQLTPQAGAGNLTFTIKRISYSYLA
jgi:hypothetical protein